MKIEYSNRALADLRKVSADSRRVFGDGIAAELGAHTHSAIAVPSAYHFRLAFSGWEHAHVVLGGATPTAQSYLLWMPGNRPRRAYLI